ncbi:hypothetical protein, partial [Vibrio parahaemolyticus]|uniref:hypothetical protein n=1 Tax=Vibrio parahaemolyticus TaxID=670 RepID=UPI001EE9B5BC
YIHMRNYKKAQICYEFRLPAKCEKNQQRFLLLINNAMQVWGSRMVEGEGVKRCTNLGRRKGEDEAIL